MHLAKEALNLAGEYAVASQLALLGHYPQLTYGNRKRADILVDSGEKLFRVEVKAKQSDEWPGVQAPRQHDFLILVDFRGKAVESRPDFYVLNFEDWKELVEKTRLHWPKMQVDATTYCVSWKRDSWTGLNPQASDVQQHLERWEKLPKASDAEC
jgi:hypothetical protein